MGRARSNCNVGKAGALFKQGWGEKGGKRSEEWGFRKDSLCLGAFDHRQPEGYDLGGLLRRKRDSICLSVLLGGSPSRASRGSIWAEKEQRGGP